MRKKIFDHDDYNDHDDNILAALRRRCRRGRRCRKFLLALIFIAPLIRADLFLRVETIETSNPALRGKPADLPQAAPDKHFQNFAEIIRFIEGERE